MLILPPLYAIMLLLLGPSGKLLNNLYTTKDLNLGGRNKRFLKSLYLYFKRLYPLKRAII